jgi:hypothetical protein
MPPVSIKRFEKLFWISIAVMVLATLLNYGTLRDRAVSEGRAAAEPAVEIAVNLGINFVLWFFIVRRASNLARWILVTLVALGVINCPGHSTKFSG